MEHIYEKKTYEISYYKAWDGEIFKTKEDCEEYENRPLVIARKNVQPFLIRKIQEHQIDIFYSENENHVYVFKPKNIKEINALNEYLSIDNMWGNKRKIKELDEKYIGKEIFVTGTFYKKKYTKEEWIKSFEEKLDEVINNEETDVDYDEEQEKIIRNKKG